MGLREDMLLEDNLQRENNLHQNVLDGDAMVSLLKHPGWKMLEEELMALLSLKGNVLRKAKDMQEIGNCQGAMNIIEHILKYPKGIVETGKEAKAELEGVEKNGR